MICLFPTLESALSFNDFVDGHIMRVKNRPDIFGEQLLCNELDEITDRLDYLLSVATDISVESLPDEVKRYGGICYPAHIDRDSNGIIAILGALPENPVFNTVEMREAEKFPEYSEKYGLWGKNVVYSSDSHMLGVMNDRDRFFDLNSERDDTFAVINELFERLR